MLTAAAAWDELASELGSAASGYDSQISGLTGGAWSGPSAESMAAAAAPYVAWLSSTATQAELAASQAKAAVAAYETAFAATVPPPVIAANRALLATLVMTNFLGVNTPAIAATEFHYTEMWAQDAAAMYSYAGASSTATQLPAFTAPPPTANPGGVAAQGTAVAHSVATGGASTSTMPELQSAMSSISTIAANLTGPYSPVGLSAVPGGWWLTATQILGLAQNVPGVNALLAGPKPITGALGPLSGGYMSLQTPTLGPAGSASGVLGHAGLVGRLSVPPGWAAAAPAVRTAALITPITSLAPDFAIGGQAGLFTEMALSSMAGRAVGATTAHSVVRTGARVVGGADDDATTVNIIVIPADEAGV